MNGRIIEESGVSLKRLLVKVDLTGCIFKEDGCLLCGSGLNNVNSGVPPTQPSADHTHP